VKILGRLILAGALLFALLQFIRPGIPIKPATAELSAPPEVRHILAKDCYSCHSGERRLAWFDQVVPAYWLVRHDILTAREHLNFSTLGTQPAAAQKAKLYEAVAMIQLGAMPLPQFVQLHPEARVTPEELAILKNYLAPWSQPPLPAAAATSLARISLTTVQPEFNGLPFFPDFETWKVISTTDRGDNNTFRFILGNDIAIKASQSGNISPWPDGAAFAKIAWQQLSPDGLITPGKFVQVEFMLKDAQRYKATDGWGWGRWRGNDLKPYGENARFVTECTGCHQPVHGDDYVYTLPITAAKVTGAEAVNNNAAALPATLPFQPLGWNAITMYVDPKTRTTATLYGNQAAIQAVQGARTAPSQLPAYPSGAVLALVTWAQREDPHWFGARIPDLPQSVEFLQTAAPGQPNTYRHFAGPSLIEDHHSAATAAQRTSFIETQAPAWLP
jgi:Cytochrome P460/Haem-binding domain